MSEVLVVKLEKRERGGERKSGGARDFGDGGGSGGSGGGGGGCGLASERGFAVGWTDSSSQDNFEDKGATSEDSDREAGLYSVRVARQGGGCGRS